MLRLKVLEEEYYNEDTKEFETHGGLLLELEHSLVSLSKWESFTQKPFLDSNDKTPEEILFYIECMILNENFSPGVLSELTDKDFVAIHDYIESPQSATTFGQMPDRKGRGEIITSELVYYWMVAFNIPFETETWHLNRLFSLIRICNIKNAPPSKTNKADRARHYRDLNAQRLQKYSTKG